MAATLSIPEINFFQTTPIIDDLITHQYIKVYPNQGWSSRYPGTIVFDVEPSASQMTCSEIKLYQRWKVVNSDGSALPADAKISVVNQPFLTMFSDIQLKLGETIIVPATGLSAFKIYLETLLGSGVDTKNTTLRSLQLYFEDTAGEFDTMDVANKGWEYRNTEMKGSAEVELEGTIPFDFTQSKLFLIPGIRIQIILTHAPDTFRILTSAGDLAPIMKVVETYLTIRRVTVQSEISLRMETMLNSGLNINYAFRRGAMVSHQIPTGATEFNETMFIGDRPKFLICFFVASDAFQGSYAKNPLRFQTISITSAQVRHKMWHSNVCSC